MAVDVKFIPFEEIDTLRWNSCVHFAPNGNVFAYHWYLKNVVREFDALVEGEYESVMPLLKSRNLAGEPVLHHPEMLGRLGVFSVHVLSQARMQSFIDAIPSDYKETRIIFNEFNRLESMEDTSSKSWYSLNMDQPYEVLSGNYSNEVHDHIEKARSMELLPDSNIKPEELIGFYKKHAKKVDEHAWMRIHYNLMHRGTAFPTTYKNKKGEIKAAGLFAYSNGYLVNLFYAAEKGAKEPLFYLMMDDIIHVHAGRPLALDFNRTDPEHLQAEKMGAVTQNIYEWEKRSKWGKIVDWVTPW